MSHKIFWVHALAPQGSNPGSIPDLKGRKGTHQSWCLKKDYGGHMYIWTIIGYIIISL